MKLGFEEKWRPGNPLLVRDLQMRCRKNCCPRQDRVAVFPAPLLLFLSPSAHDTLSSAVPPPSFYGTPNLREVSISPRKRESEYIINLSWRMPMDGRTTGVKKPPDRHFGREYQMIHAVRSGIFIVQGDKNRSW